MDPVARSLDLVEDATVLDRICAPLGAAVRSVLRNDAVRDALHGVWMGHPLHPALVQLPVGCFISAGLLDLTGPAGERSARILILTGLVSAGPAAAAGLADWSQMHEQQQRVGVVHAAANVLGLACYASSLAARVQGRAPAGRALALAGLGVMSVGAYLGGHLAYRQAGGANHAEDVPHLVPPGWHDLCAVDDLPNEGEPARFVLHSVPVVLVRRDDRIDVLSDRCSHLSGPLHEGRVTGEGTCIECPWHGSTFRLDDGSVVRGPATSPQHSFDVRVELGRVQVRLPGAG